MAPNKSDQSEQQHQPTRNSGGPLRSEHQSTRSTGGLPRSEHQSRSERPRSERSRSERPRSEQSARSSGGSQRSDRSEPPARSGGPLKKITPQQISWFEASDPNQIRAELFQEAEEIADKILEEPVEGKKPLSSTQLRRYYNEVKALDYRVKGWRTLKPQEQEVKFTEILPLIKLLRAKVEYKRNAKAGRISKSFAQFMADCIHSVNSLREFEAFVMFFEAVVGFYIGRNERS